MEATLLSQHVEKVTLCCRVPHHVFLFVLCAIRCMPQGVLHICALQLEADAHGRKLTQR